MQEQYHHPGRGEVSEIGPGELHLGSDEGSGIVGQLEGRPVGSPFDPAGDRVLQGSAHEVQHGDDQHEEGKGGDVGRPGLEGVLANKAGVVDNSLGRSPARSG